MLATEYPRTYGAIDSISSLNTSNHSGDLSRLYSPDSLVPTTERHLTFTGYDPIASEFALPSLSHNTSQHATTSQKQLVSTSPYDVLLQSQQLRNAQNAQRRQALQRTIVRQPQSSSDTIMSKQAQTLSNKPKTPQANAFKLSPEPASRAEAVEVVLQPPEQYAAGPEPWKRVSAEVTLITSTAAQAAEYRHIQRQWDTYVASGSLIVVPETDGEKLPYVKQVKGAIMNCQDVDDQFTDKGYLTTAYKRFVPDPNTGKYRYSDETVEILAWKIVVSGI